MYLARLWPRKSSYSFSRSCNLRSVYYRSFCPKYKTGLLLIHQKLGEVLELYVLKYLQLGGSTLKESEISTTSITRLET